MESPNHKLTKKFLKQLVKQLPSNKVTDLSILNTFKLIVSQLDSGIIKSTVQSNLEEYFEAFSNLIKQKSHVIPTTEQPSHSHEESIPYNISPSYIPKLEVMNTSFKNKNITNFIMKLKHDELNMLSIPNMWLLINSILNSKANKAHMDNIKGYIISAYSTIQEKNNSVNDDVISCLLAYLIIYNTQVVSIIHIPSYLSMGAIKSSTFILKLLSWLGYHLSNTKSTDSTINQEYFTHIISLIEPHINKCQHDLHKIENIDLLPVFLHVLTGYISMKQYTKIHNYPMILQSKMIGILKVLHASIISKYTTFPYYMTAGTTNDLLTHDSLFIWKDILVPFLSYENITVTHNECSCDSTQFNKELISWFIQSIDSKDIINLLYSYKKQSILSSLYTTTTNDDDSDNNMDSYHMKSDNQNINKTDDDDDDDDDENNDEQQISFVLDNNGNNQKKGIHNNTSTTFTRYMIEEEEEEEEREEEEDDDDVKNVSSEDILEYLTEISQSVSPHDTKISPNHVNNTMEIQKDNIVTPVDDMLIELSQQHQSANTVDNSHSQETSLTVSSLESVDINSTNKSSKKKNVKTSKKKATITDSAITTPEVFLKETIGEAMTTASSTSKRKKQKTDNPPTPTPTPTLQAVDSSIAIITDSQDTSVSQETNLEPTISITKTRGRKKKEKDSSQEQVKEESQESQESGRSKRIVKTPQKYMSA